MHAAWLLDTLQAATLQRTTTSSVLTQFAAIGSPAEQGLPQPMHVKGGIEQG